MGIRLLAVGMSRFPHLIMHGKINPYMIAAIFYTPVDIYFYHHVVEREGIYAQLVQNQPCISYVLEVNHR